MEPKNPSHVRTSAFSLFNVQAFLDSPEIGGAIVEYERGKTIFTVGDAGEDVLYIRTGAVKLTVRSKSGREAVVAMLGPGDFFGEGCLAGQPRRMGTATATAPSTIIPVGKAKMVALLHDEHDVSDRFISHMLARNIRIEEDLIDQLFNPGVKQLARDGKQDKPARTITKISRDALAKAAGTARARVKSLLSRFKRRGFVECNGGIPLAIDCPLSSILPHD